MAMVVGVSGPARFARTQGEQWQIGITCEGEHIALKSGSCIQAFGQQSTGEQLIQASVYFSIWDVRDHSLGIIPLLPASKLMDSYGYVE